MTSELGTADHPNLPTNPLVRVEDQFGNGNEGVTVTFTPRTGSGSVGSGSVLADVNGETSTTWAPGQSGSNLLDVTAGSFAETFFAVASNSAYKLEVIFVTSATIAQKTAFGDAAGRWMDIITGDLVNIDFGSGFGDDACGVGDPNITGVQDDLIVFVSLVAIDGPGGLVGCIRSHNSLTLYYARLRNGLKMPATPVPQQETPSNTFAAAAETQNSNCTTTRGAPGAGLGSSVAYFGVAVLLEEVGRDLFGLEHAGENGLVDRLEVGLPGLDKPLRYEVEQRVVELNHS